MTIKYGETNGNYNFKNVILQPALVIEQGSCQDFLFDIEQRIVDNDRIKTYS